MKVVPVIFDEIVPYPDTLEVTRLPEPVIEPPAKVTLPAVNELAPFMFTVSVADP